MKKILTFVAAAFLALSASAIPPQHIPFAISDGSGSTVMLYKHGDKGLDFYTTLDGKIVVRDAQGCLVYAIESGGLLQPSSIRVHDIAKRTDAELAYASEALTIARYAEAKRTLQAVNATSGPLRAHYSSTTDGLGKYGYSALGVHPSVGKFNIPVIMVEYADVKFKESTTIEFMDRYYNEEGFSSIPGVPYTIHGSVRDYFYDQSRGMFDPHFDVVAKVTLSNGYAYYGQNVSTGKGKGDKNAYALVKEAIQLARAEGVDFKQYIHDATSNVPLVCILYAGEGEATSDDENTIWPHQNEIPYNSSNIGGTRFSGYFMGNELVGTTLMGMGTFVHEFCHAIGLPDFYDSTYSYSGNQPFGLWDIMDVGPYNDSSYNPVGMSAYERSYFGWLNIPEVKANQAVTLAHPDEDYDNSMFMMRMAGSEKDYFIFENVSERKWSPSGSGAGLYVTRYHYNQNNWAYNTVNVSENKKMAMCVTANGEEINSNARPAHLFGVSTFDIPAYSLWNGNTDTERPVYQIVRHSDGTITLNVGERNLYSTTASDGRIFQRVNSMDELASGDSIILVNETERMVANANVCASARAVSQIYLPENGKAMGNADLQVFRAIKTSDGKKWGLQFKQNGSNAYLKAGTNGALTSATKTDASCLATISVKDGKAAIRLGTSSTGYITYFTDNTRMACGGDADNTGVSIYRLAGVEAGITAVATDDHAASKPIYTLSGRYAGTDLQSLPAGIYILEGKKVVR